MVHEHTEVKEDLDRILYERTKELRESREKYRRLVQSTVDGIVTSDKQGIITFVNRGLTTLIGYSKEEMLGQPIWHFYTGGIDQAKQIMKQIREKGNIANFEMELIGRDRIIPIRTSASILKNDEDEEIGSLGIFSDLTNRRKLEEQLRRAQADLVQTMKLRALGDLVSGVAHEINNPLMASITMLHVMEKSADRFDEPTRKRLAILKKCNERIARIVDHLREFARQSETHREPLDLNRPIENALLITGQQLLNMGMEIHRALCPNLPLVMGDANQLEQVFIDMIANARDAMEGQSEPKVIAISSSVGELDGHPAIAVTISDTGPGIKEEIRDKLFEPFFTTKPVGKGTGLGLAICHSIIDEHKGRIEVESEEGKGATFTILLLSLEQTTTQGVDGNGIQDPAY